jgi:alpha-mannosidase
LTLLRSSTWPDPQADVGQHQFTYVIYPHVGSWSEAEIVRRGAELNSPLQLVLASTQNGSASSTHSFLDFGAAGEQLVLMALQPAHDHPDQLVLRCYESAGQAGMCDLQNSLGLKMGEAIDLLETHLADTEQHQSVNPWQIKSWLLHHELASKSNTIPS